MRVTLLFFLYLFGCLILAALLSPVLLATGWLDLEPQRVMGRLAQVMILLGIWPFLRFLSLTGRDSLGYGVSARAWRRSVGWGWLQGVAILLALALVLLALDIRVPDPPSEHWFGIAGQAVQALLGGLLIGILEETFFRGALYSAIRRRDGRWAAVVWSSLLYAVLHFMKPGALPEGMAFDGSGALWMFRPCLQRCLSMEKSGFPDRAFCVGVFLALVRERTGQIGWCIGLHAGWVFVIQMTRRLTNGNEAASFSFLVGDYDGTIGWLAAFWIGLLALGYWVLTRRSSA